MDTVQKSKVALVRTSAKNVLDDVHRVCELGGMQDALPQEAPVILKDNITWHLPFLSANTTPWQLEGCIRALQAQGYQKLIGVHNDTVVTKPKAGLRNLKLQMVYDAYGLEQHYVNDPSDVAWESWRPQGPTPWLDHVYPEGLQFPRMFHGKSVLHLPTVKTHIYTTTTGAVKNSFGGLLNTKRHYCHTWIHGVLADLVAVQKELHTGMFAVADGTLAGNGPGPRTMQPVEKNLLIASADPVAMDAVAARLMGFDPLNIELFQECQKRGLGAVEEKDIEIVGDDFEFGWGFSVGDNLASSVGDQLWFGAFKGLQYLMFRTPIVKLFVAGSHIYHDEWWWRRHGRKRMDKVAATSQWGKLFADYRPKL